MSREQQHGWPTNPIVLMPISTMLRRPRPFVRATAAWQPPVGTSDALGVGARWFGPMLLWALSLRQAEGGIRPAQFAASPATPAEGNRTRSMNSPAVHPAPGISPRAAGERMLLSTALPAGQPNRSMPRGPVLLQPLVTVTTEPPGTRPGHQPTGRHSAPAMPGAWHGSQSPASTQRDIGRPAVSGLLSRSVPLSVAELLVPKRDQMASVRSHPPVQVPGLPGGRTSQHLLLSGLPLMVSPPMAGEQADIERAAHLAHPAQAVPFADSRAPDVAAQPVGGLHLDNDRRAGAGTFRHGIGRELSALMSNITRVVEERIEQVTRQTLVIPPSAPVPREPTAQDVYRLSRIEHREREFRVGR